MKATAIPTASRETVKARDHGRCARCRGYGWQWHHRRSKSVRDWLTHSPANGVLLCSACHVWVHANPGQAQASGFIVSRWKDPRRVPIQHVVFGPVYLTEQGKTQPVRSKP